MEGPRLARLLANVLLPPAEREFIVGDLEELFGWRVARYGRWRATWLYVRDVIVSVISRRRPGRQAKQSHSPAQRASIMKGLLGDARAAARTLRREPGFTGLAIFTLALGIGSTAAALISEIRTAVEAILPDKAVADPTPLTDRVDNIHSERRIFSRLLGLLSALAVLLAAVGLYGVIAFNVAGRRREFGIRLAIGARPGRIGSLVARYAARIIGPGIALGFIGAYAFSRILENRLFGVAPTDAASYLLGALLFSTVAAFACLAPMRSALRVNPLITLKQE